MKFIFLGFGFANLFCTPVTPWVYQGTWGCDLVEFGWGQLCTVSLYYMSDRVFQVAYLYAKFHNVLAYMGHVKRIRGCCINFALYKCFYSILCCDYH